MRTGHGTAHGAAIFFVLSSANKRNQRHAKLALDKAGLALLGPYYGLSPATLQPSDIAGLALFLVSDEARQINGAIVPADGGWLTA